MTDNGRGMARLATHTGIAESYPDYQEVIKFRVDDNTMPSALVSDYSYSMHDKEMSGRKLRNYKNAQAVNNSADYI